MGFGVRTTDTQILNIWKEHQRNTTDTAEKSILLYVSDSLTAVTGSINKKDYTNLYWSLMDSLMRYLDYF